MQKEKTGRRAREKVAPLEHRRLPIGAEPLPGGVHFRVWAPERRRVAVQIDGRAATALGPASATAAPPAQDPLPPTALKREDGGYFSGWVQGAETGTLYRYRILATDLAGNVSTTYSPVVLTYPTFYSGTPREGCSQSGEGC